MQARILRLQTSPHRSGHILVMFAVVVTTLLAVLGLVIDGGLLMTSQRQAQNAADAAARACARAVRDYEAIHNSTAIPLGDLRAIAKTYAFDPLYNNVPTTPDDPGTPLVDESAAWLVVNHGPLTGPYVGNARYVEVKVTYPLRTAFIQVVGIGRDRKVTSRAVSGYELEPRGAGLVILDPDPPDGSGLKISGGGVVTVDDRLTGKKADVYVYSLHEGQDGSGGTTTPVPPYNGVQAAAKVENNTTFIAGTVNVSGGVNNEDNFSFDRGVDKLVAGTLSPVYDPFHIDPGQLAGPKYLPTPTTNNGVAYQGNKNNPVIGKATFLKVGKTKPPDQQGNIAVTSGDFATLEPGIYTSISINGGDVTLQPGIYVLKLPSANGGTDVLTISGSSFVHGVGGTNIPANVMFYNTGHDYNAVTGSPDTSDYDYAAGARTDVQPTTSSNFGRIKITGGTVRLSGLNTAVTTAADASFNKMLFYQRRAHDGVIQVNQGSDSALDGILYAKWGELQLAGSGIYNFAIVVGRLTVSGGATIHVNDTVPFPPVLQFVYLVE